MIAYAKPNARMGFKATIMGCNKGLARAIRAGPSVHVAQTGVATSQTGEKSELTSQACGKSRMALI